MKAILVNLYDFVELSKEVQQEVINRERFEYQDIQMDIIGNEYRTSLSKFEELLQFKTIDWSVCSYNYEYRIKVDSDFDDLTGKLLLRHLNNNVLPHLYKGKYYFRFKGTNVKGRHSKVLFDYDCLLTGICYDNYLTDILFSQLKYYDIHTYSDLINVCLDNFFKAWQDEYVYFESDKAVREYLENTDINYLENGKTFEETN